MSDVLTQFKAIASSAIPAKGRLGVAVSGGGDSVALLRLLHQTYGPERLCVLHFNHNLREESQAEAEWVQKLATELQIPFFMDRWVNKPVGNIQQLARRARYTFFCQMTRRNGLAGVCVGHTKDDVTETMLMRLGRGSGVQGLASMKTEVTLGDVTVIRPMLNLSRSSLRPYLEDLGQTWCEDPSNTSQKYLRSRLREGISTLEQIGLPSRAMADAAVAIQRADAALESVTFNFFQTDAVPAPNGGMVVSSKILQQPDEIAQRIVEQIILDVQPAPIAPRVSKRLRLLDNFREGAQHATLGGVKFTRTSNGFVCQREA
ncbi:MAG: tRNA lysidine(34) synthetase TilS [Alphaproteobacteria bacterium]|nr:tRNA lysidine(34) synthetase TilS [Alphaproteobacteria bacterium]MDD9919491.1 tRNA lysidine(34) synthetase TilS [Alphaproteobacteria bacterium]